MAALMKRAILGLCAGLLVLPTMAAAAETEPASLAAPIAPSPLSGQSIYFVMTDRYANGIPSNDDGAGRGGFNPTNIGFFHGGDFAGLRQNLDRIQRMGFTAIWITPPFVQQTVQGDSAAYHGYWGLDFLNVDPHFGTLSEFRELVDDIHSRGMRIYLDVVVNHTADVIRYRDGLSFVGPGRTKDAYIPETAPSRNPSWLNNLANYTNRGDASSCGWSGEDCLVNGDFFGLDDINTRNPEVVQGWIDVYSWWVREFKIDGFRVDTAKHVDPEFLPTWSAAVTQAARESGIEHFAMFGEFYEGGVLRLSEYVRESGLTSALDFPGQSAVVGFASRTHQASALRAHFAQDDRYTIGGSSDGTPRHADGLVTFGGNHDMGRIGLEVAAASNTLGRHLLDRTLLAHSILFLSRGAPAVYYGDEVGMMGEGGDKAARQSMFPTRVPVWRTEYRIGSPPIGTRSSLTPAAEQHPIAIHIRNLNALRRDHPTLASGQMIMRLAQGSVAAWSKVHHRDRIEYIVAVNSGNQSARISVPTGTPRTAFRPLLGTGRTAVSSPTGEISVSVPARGTVVLRAVREMPGDHPVPEISVSSAVRDGLTDTRLVSARVGATRDAITVTFVGRPCGTCEWQTLATDGAAPFRYFMPDSWFRETPEWQVVGVVRSSDGDTRTSEPVTVRR